MIGKNKIEYISQDSLLQFLVVVATKKHEYPKKASIKYEYTSNTSWYVSYIKKYIWLKD
jgi:hypothetical protein